MAAGSPARLTPAEGRRFAFTLAAAFGVLAGVAWWRAHQTPATVLGALAAALAAAGLLVPARLGPVRRAWMGLAHAISRVTTPVFMGVVYFLVITPIALVRRSVGGNPLRKQHGADGWADRGGAPRGDLTRQF